MTHVKLEQEKGTLVARLVGEIDHHGAEMMRVRIDDRIGCHMPEKLVLDFSDVTFMDSSGVGLILGRHRIVSEHGGVVVVQRAPQDIKRVLAIAGIDAKE